MTDYDARLASDMQVIVFDTICGMFRDWDVGCGLVDQPKSDVVCGAVARAFYWPTPRGPFIGSRGRLRFT